MARMRAGEPFAATGKFRQASRGRCGPAAWNKRRLVIPAHLRPLLSRRRGGHGWAPRACCPPADPGPCAPRCCHSGSLTSQPVWSTPAALGLATGEPLGTALWRGSAATNGTAGQRRQLRRLAWPRWLPEAAAIEQPALPNLLLPCAGRGRYLGGTAAGRSCRSGSTAGRQSPCCGCTVSVACCARCRLVASVLRPPHCSNCCLTLATCWDTPLPGCSLLQVPTRLCAGEGLGLVCVPVRGSWLGLSMHERCCSALCAWPTRC